MFPAQVCLCLSLIAQFEQRSPSMHCTHLDVTSVLESFCLHAGATVQRQYMALVQQSAALRSTPDGTITDPLIGRAGVALPASTAYRTLHSKEDFALLHLTPKTGTLLCSNQQHQAASKAFDCQHWHACALKSALLCCCEGLQWSACSTCLGMLCQHWHALS